MTRLQVYALDRHDDVSGVSGEGVVAYAVEWPDGTVSMRWSGTVASTTAFDNIDDLDTIHGHGGKTQLQLVVAVELPTLGEHT